MTPNTWAVVPTAGPLSSIDPGVGANDITPSGADWETRGMTAGLFSWVGMAWDEANRTAWVPIGGGHTDYGGNEPYKIDLSAETPQWVMVRPPSGAVPPGPTLTTRDGQEASGVYSDGRLRAQHTYNNCCYVPGVGPALGRSTAHHYSGTGHSRRTYTIDAESGEATLVVDYMGNSGAGNGEGASVFDPTRGSNGTIWSLGSATSTLVQIDVAAGTATNRGTTDNWLATSGAMVYVPASDVAGGDKLIHYPDNRGGGLLGVRDLTTFAAARPTLSGSFSAGFTIPSGDGFGFTWCSAGYIALWNNTTNTTEISTLTPSDPADLTQPWTRGTLAVSGSNAVTPSAANGSGTFSRFWFSESFNGFFLLNDTDENLYFFALG